MRKIELAFALPKFAEDEFISKAVQVRSKRPWQKKPNATVLQLSGVRVTLPAQWNALQCRGRNASERANFDINNCDGLRSL
jgi:hypothetical protein